MDRMLLPSSPVLDDFPLAGFAFRDAIAFQRCMACPLYSVILLKNFRCSILDQVLEAQDLHHYGIQQWSSKSLNGSSPVSFREI